jgi:hypothetical protein
MVTRLQAGCRGSGSDSRWGTASKRPLSSTKYPKKWVPGTSSEGLKQAGHEAVRSPQSIAELNWWSYISIPPLHDVMLN